MAEIFNKKICLKTHKMALKSVKRQIRKITQSRTKVSLDPKFQVAMMFGC